MNMKKNLYAPTPTVGAFNQNPENHLVSMLNSLNETFANEYNMDFVKNIADILDNQMLAESYKDIVFGDYHQYQAADPLSESIHQLNVAKIEQLFENSSEELLSEASASTLNPIVGLTFPLLKKNWVENIMKDFLPTEVATTSVINRQLEKLYLQDSTGKKYYIPDIFEENQAEAREAMKATDRPLTADLLTVPAVSLDIMTKSGGSVRQRDSISRNFRVASATFTISDDETVEVACNIKPQAETNVFSGTITATDKSGTEHIDMIFGQLDFSTGILNAACSAGKITGIKIAGTLSAENNMKSSSVGWETENKQFIIPTGRHLNTGLTEERLKEDKIVYKTDGMAKAITDMTRVLNYMKDTDMYDYVLESRETIKDNAKLFVKTSFDCKPQGQYALTSVEWRSIQLKEVLDNVAIELRKVLRTPNCFFAVVGNPRDVKLLGDVNWSITSGADIVGGCALNYSFGVVNAQHKFLVLSSDTIPQGKLRVIIRPTTEDFISYTHFDYSFFISNNYRDPNMPNVPSVMASNSYLTDDVIPAQAEIEILNNNISPSEMYTM